MSLNFRKRAEKLFYGLSGKEIFIVGPPQEFTGSDIADALRHVADGLDKSPDYWDMNLVLTKREPRSHERRLLKHP